jgi:hypothetical protein
MKFIKQVLVAGLCIVQLSACATGRNISSPHYLPEWENQVFNAPSPSETSAGFWTVKAVEKISYGIGRALLIPFAVAGNIAMNAYYIVTWPIRWPLRGDKRLIVWYPLFHVGEDVGSDYYSKEWNRDLN